jgi:tetratricopeptide (TPR) repeat protein
MLYLSLIFYPAPTRLSITHDFEVSAALLRPWTTLPSLVAVAGLIALAIWRIRRWPFVSFAILFFFLNHAIESGIIGLEMVFEHRNYLPSMFLFLPVAAGIARTMDHFRPQSRAVTFGLWVFVPLLLVGLGTGTYIRNQAWESEKTLWEDALAKAPGESRPYHMLAGHHYDRIGDFDTSMRLYHLSLTRRMTRLSHKALIYNNMAALHYGRKNYEAAVESWTKSVDAFSDYRLGRFFLAQALTRTNRFDEALAHLEKILKQRPDYFAPRNLQGVIFIRQGKHSEALTSFKRCLKSGGVNRPLMINLGAAFYYLGDYSKAGMFFGEALKRAPNDRTALAWLARTYLRADSDKRADGLIAELLSTDSAADLIVWLNSCVGSGFEEDDVVPPDVDVIFLERLRKVWIQTVGGIPGRPVVDAPQPGPIE